MSLKLPKRLPHLDGALRLTADRGLCFHRAAGLVLDLPPATLAVGTLPAATHEQHSLDPNVSMVDFIHAWVEVQDLVLAPTLLERSRETGMPWVFPKDVYYSVNSPRDVSHMTRGRLKQLSVEYGLADHLKNFTPLKNGAKFGDVILNEMGVAFVVTGRGGVIPAPVGRE